MNRNKDLISEEEYNKNMTGRSTSPQKDSPGDSESDAQAEFLMGFNYDAETATGTKAQPKKGRRQFDDLPETAKVVSSEVPSPSLDFNKETDTH